MKTRITVLALAWLVTGVALAADPPAQPQGPPGPNMDRLALLLDLNDYQKTEVEKVLKEQHEQFRAAREQAKSSGERPTREEMRAKHEQMKQELHTKLSSVLDEQQLKKFDALQEQRGGFGGPRRGESKETTAQ
jgi:Spy/CpxP family protein refolding chaperone